MTTPFVKFVKETLDQEHFIGEGKIKNMQFLATTLSSITPFRKRDRGKHSINEPVVLYLGRKPNYRLVISAVASTLTQVTISLDQEYFL